MQRLLSLYYKEIRHQHSGGVAVLWAIPGHEMHQSLWHSLHDMKCPINVIWIINFCLATLPLSPWFVNWCHIVIDAISK